MDTTWQRAVMSDVSPAGIVIRNASILLRVAKNMNCCDGGRGVSNHAFSASVDFSRDSKFKLFRYIT